MAFDNDDGNPLEKKGYQKDMFNQFRKDELTKCAKDPMYFVKNYVKVESTEFGEIPFEPYEYQENIIKGFHEHKNTICMVGRQMGKCVSGTTKIKYNNEKVRIDSLVKLSMREKIINFLENCLVKLS